MNTDTLKEFIVLAETKNFWEASERLYLNQSTLSKHIKSLECELNVKLFNRTTRRIELTNYGQVFLPFAKSIIRSEFDGTAAIKRLKNIENGLLTLGSIPSMPQYKITQLIANFQQSFPDTTIRITEDDSINLIAELENQNCEIVFLREDKASFEDHFMNDENITRIPYIKDQLAALLPQSHRLSSEKAITLQQLSEDSFCLLKENTLMYQISIDACQNAGFIPDIVFTSHRIDALLDMVSNQNCVALVMDRHMMMPQNGPKQVECPWSVVPIIPQISSQISLCYRNDKPLSKSAQLFVDFCNDMFFNK